MTNTDPTLDQFMSTIDKSKFTTDSTERRVEKPWGYELLLAPEGSRYTAKIMHVEGGTRQSLQIHEEKIETYLIMSGRGGVEIENASGEMVKIEFKPEVGYTTQIGQKHRIFAITDCDVVEFSTPESGTTWRLEDDYARPDETEELRAEPDRGWKD